jgi:hypothetical protein
MDRVHGRCRCAWYFRSRYCWARSPVGCGPAGGENRLATGLDVVACVSLLSLFRPTYLLPLDVGALVCGLGLSAAVCIFPFLGLDGEGSSSGLLPEDNCRGL